MSLPGVKLNVQDFGLGSLPPLGEGIQVKIGVASAGVVNDVKAITTLDQCKELGSGPLPEACAVALAEGAGLIYAIRVNASVAGVAGAVTKTGSGSGTLALTGSTPLDAYQLVVQITRAGANLVAGTAAFVYSLDGGDTFSEEIAVPTGGSYAISGTGITLVFTNGGSGTSFEVGDKYTSTCTAPAYNSTDLMAALDALFARTALKYQFIHVVGAASAAIAAAVNTRLATAEANFRYTWAVLEAAKDTDAALSTAFAAFSSVRVGVAAGYDEVVSPLSGRVYERNAAWAYTGRRAARSVEEHAGRVATGSLRTVSKLVRDEALTPGLDAARFTTLRSFVGYPGVFVTRGRLMAPAGSDFELDVYRQVMDQACTLAYQAGLRFVNESIRVDPTTGYILEKEAVAIEAYIQGIVRTGLRGKISETVDGQPAAYIRVDRAENILSSKTLVIDVGIVPLGYAETVWFKSIRYVNPQLLLQTGGTA